MLLGKFEVWRDEGGNRYAIPELAIGSHPGIDVLANKRDVESFAGQRDPAALPGNQSDPIARIEGTGRPRDLQRFLTFLKRGAPSLAVTSSPRGKLEPVRHAEAVSRAPKPLWGNINDLLYRWNNNATAAWTLKRRGRTVPLGPAGDVKVFCGQGTGIADLVVDVTGYFQ